MDEETAIGWDQSTDLAAALSTVLESVPPEELAGAGLVTDGRHNRPGRVEEAARRFGILDAPIGVLAVGSPDPPRDAALVSVEAPEAIHLGDRMRVRAEVKFDGYQGKKAMVRLLRGEEILKEHEVAIPQETSRGLRTSVIRITLDTKSVNGYNEIDAVSKNVIKTMCRVQETLNAISPV